MDKLGGTKINQITSLMMGTIGNYKE